MQAAQSIVLGYKAAADSGTLQEDAQNAAIQALRLSRYSGAEGTSEYFYIWSLDLVGVMHPLSRNGKARTCAASSKMAMAAILCTHRRSASRQQRRQGICACPTFTRPGSTAWVPKLQYAVRIDGWNWMVGSARSQTSDLGAPHGQPAGTSAAQVAQRGGAVVAEVVQTMGAINASSTKISDIIRRD